jgi:phenylalanyl-tRNA synthetase alpha chain
LVPGRNFRYEQIDASHGFEFWQIEGFVVDKNIRLTDLFGTIAFVLNKLFGGEAKIKFATTNFPFVEPGVDAYLQCTLCKGKGCPFCKNAGWSEIMPAGMIHPNVLKQAGINHKLWSGFAFAIGFSRIVNLKYGIKDLRTLTTPDMRILKQF